MKKILYLLAVTVMAVMSSCSSEDTSNLLQLVPADADFVATLNLDELATEAGVSLTDEVNALRGCVNAEAVVAYGQLPSEVYLLAEVADGGKLAATLRDSCGLEESEAQGFTLYGASGNRVGIAVKDGKIWISAQASDIAANITRQLEKAKEESIDGNPELRELLVNDNTANVLVKANAVMSQFDMFGPLPLIGMLGDFPVKYFLVQADMADKKLTLRSRNIGKNGDVTEIPYLTEMNVEALEFIPSDFNVGFGVAISPEIIGQAVSAIRSFGGFLGQSQQEKLERMLPFLESAEGTITVGANAPLSDLFSSNLRGYQDLDMTAVVSFRNGKAGEFLGLLKEFTSAMGLNPSTVASDGSLQYQIPADYGETLTLSLKAAGNHLVISNLDNATTEVE